MGGVSAHSPLHSTALARASRGGLCALTLVLVLTACSDDPEPAPPQPSASPSPSLAVIVPADGELQVAAAGKPLGVIPQVVGVCEGGARPGRPTSPAPAPAASTQPPPAQGSGGGGCSFLPPTTPPVITSAAPRLTLTSERSTTFELTILAESGQILPAPLQGRELDVSKLPPGRYQLTVRGDAGGVWQLTLARPKP